MAVECQSQLRELYAAQLAFAADNRGRFTPISQSADRWQQLLGSYVSKSGMPPRDIMHCPASSKAADGSISAQNYSTYAVNPSLRLESWRYRRDARMDSSRIILMGDKPDHATDDFLTTADGWFVVGDGEYGQWWRYTSHNPRGSLRHGKGASVTGNALMADGHVRSLDQEGFCRDSGHWYWGDISRMPRREVATGCCPQACGS